MSKSALTLAQRQQLIATATKALDNSYAPYSKFKVGAAVLTSQDNIFAGCNVENASYGLSMCAERNAIANAIIGEGKDTIKIKAIAITNNQQVSCSPCGACRQVIWEFVQDVEVIFW
ncbi:MAG: cytidine deaminase [Pleurocapsa sp.]